MLARALCLLVAMVGLARATAVPDGDLVAAFPSARLGVETGLIDFGVPQARPHLLAGFGTDEQGFVWSVGPYSVLEFHLAHPRDLPLTFRCAPFQFPGAPPQAVTFELNGQAGPRVALGSRVANYHVVLPGAAARAGWNRLTLRYAWARRPFEVIESSDRRALAVAWDFILIDDELPGPRQLPTVTPELPTLTIPAGTAVSWHVDAPRGTSLSIERVTPEPGVSTQVSMVLEGDGGKREVLSRVTRPLPQRWEVPLPRGWDGPMRLTFAADGGTVRLRRPALVARAKAAPPPPRAAAPERRPNVVVYLVDTLRADRLGCYGHDRPTSPRTDALARDGILFTRAVAESSWTRTSVASLFTGLAPPRHGVYDRWDALREDTTTLAAILRDAGWETAGFITNGNVAGSLGFARGFDVYELLPAVIAPSPHHAVAGPLPRSNDLHVWARRWLRRARDPNRPFFLYLHAADPHGPYIPPARFRRRLGVPEADARAGSIPRLVDLNAYREPVYPDTPARLLALYDAEIAHNDHYFGRLLLELKRRGLYDDTLIVFVADHGEEFWEHAGWEHGKTLYEEAVHIPLVVKLPGNAHAGRRLNGPAQLADVVPTILGRLGISAPSGLDGRDLLAELDHHPPNHRPLVAQLDLDGYVAASIERGSWKLVTGWGGGELFDRRADPDDRHNVASNHLETLGTLHAELAARTARDPAATRRADELPDDVVRNLRALGYIQ